MDAKIKALNMALNQIYKRSDEQYHNYGVFCGLSDPAIWVLYTLYESEDKTFTQNDLAAMWFYPKQTINFTVNSLMKKGWLQLEQLATARNSKAIRMTEDGKRLCLERIVPLMEAEERSFLRLTESEREQLLQLTEKQCVCFEEEVKKLIKE